MASLASTSNAGTALDAVARAVTLFSPMGPHDSDRQVTQLELACVRSGRTWDKSRVSPASPCRGCKPSSLAPQ